MQDTMQSDTGCVLRTRSEGTSGGCGIMVPLLLKHHLYPHMPCGGHRIHEDTVQ